MPSTGHIPSKPGHFFSTNRGEYTKQFYDAGMSLEKQATATRRSHRSSPDRVFLENQPFWGYAVIKHRARAHLYSY